MRAMRIIGVMALVLGALAALAGEQATVLTGANGTNCAIGGSSTALYTNQAFSSIQDTQLCLQVSFTALASASTNSSTVTLVFYSSNDTINWAPEFTWPLTVATNASAKAITARTNYVLNAAPFLELFAITNADTAALTNVCLTAYGKPGF